MGYFILKWVLVFFLMVTGGVFLAAGFGVDIPLVKYHGIEAYGVPAGVAFLIAGVALAALWKISHEVVVTESITQIFEDGSSVTTHSESKITTKLKPPGA